MLVKRIAVPAFLLAVGLSALPASAQPQTPAARTPMAEREPLERPAVAVRRPDRAAFLAVTRAGQRIVAVGERGLIVYSDDDGGTWRQGAVPVSVTLTSVAFADAAHGWAAGHSGVVLKTENGGATWTRQLDGRAAAEAMMSAARSADPTGRRGLLKRAERLVADGPDKPFLALWVQDARNAFVAGAYGLLFRTSDGGATWTPETDALDNPRELHLNAVAGGGRTVYLAGEQGMLARSDDGGRRFQRLTSPYEGTFFAVAADEAGIVVAAGLRGGAFLSPDRGTTWTRLTGAPDVPFNTALRRPDGSFVLGNHAGRLFRVDVDGRALVPLPSPALAAPLTHLHADTQGRVLVASLAGVTLFPGARP